MPNIKKKFEEHPRFLYVISFLVAIMSYCVLWLFTPCNTDVNSARSMISALVESEAAIVAIVITLSLVAVQLAASSYSSRITEIFGKKYDLLFMMILYIFAIGFGVFILKKIEANSELVFILESEKEVITLKMMEKNSGITVEECIRFSYSLGILCLTALIPYTYNMFNMLKPSTIIRELSHEISKEKILQEDSIQPIIDIVRSSIMKYDCEIAKEGLRKIELKVSAIFSEKGNNASEKGNNAEEKEKISEKVFGHLSRVGKLATRQEDESSATEVIENIEKMTNILVENDLEMATRWAVESLERIGKAATKKELDMVIHEVVESLERIGIVEAKKNLHMATRWAAEALGEIGRAAVEEELGLMADEVAESLERIGIVEAENDLEMATHWTAEWLENIGDAAVKKKLEIAAYGAVESLERIGKAAAKEKLHIATQKTVESLGEIGRAAVEEELELIAQNAVESLGEIGRAAVEEELELIAQNAVESLGEIGQNAAREELKNVVTKALEYLKKIKEIEDLESFEEVASAVQHSLNDIEEVIKKI